MSTKILIFMLASASGSILAMESVDNQLLRAAREGNAAEVQALIERYANVNAKETGPMKGLGQIPGQTPLIIAANAGHENIVILLIKNGADLNAQDDVYGNTALTYAAWKDNISICKLLLEAGANVNIPNKITKTTVLWIPARKGNAQLLILLLTHIPLADQEQIKNRFALNYAMKANRQDKDIRQLISTTLFDVLVQEQMQRIEKLLAHKAQNGKTVRELVDPFHPEIAKLLDLSNPESNAVIRKQVAKNVQRVIRGE